MAEDAQVNLEEYWEEYNWEETIIYNALDEMESLQNNPNVGTMVVHHKIRDGV
ncbi:hypothetical protein THARTR1_08139 [Trichoderma harzianum]|uniref:Uncharacterized protein n=1 Tax=Trichoderma harzianum TaxID=5544 RepID=A0A2K0U0D6_TRIHA|nr:hypothetical protein THARTR1_08139 [Trichoderma harzianum]